MTDNLWLCGPCRSVASSPSSSSFSIEECSSPLGDSIGTPEWGDVIIAAVSGICLLYRKGGQKRLRFALLSPLWPPLVSSQGHANNGRMVSAHQESILNMSPAVLSFLRSTLPLREREREREKGKKDGTTTIVIAQICFRDLRGGRNTGTAPHARLRNAASFV